MGEYDNYNKVVYGDKVILDLTGDTVVPGAILKGYTAHDASGTKITGTYESPQPVLITKSVIENGTYTASVDNPAANGYSSVTVNVNDTPVLKTKTITQNGAYKASDDNADGYSTVTVNVSPRHTTTKTITQNGTYEASDDNADAYTSVTVDVSSSLVLTNTNIFSNGTYRASDFNADGFSYIVVSVSGDIVVVYIDDVRQHRNISFTRWMSGYRIFDIVS